MFLYIALVYPITSIILSLSTLLLTILYWLWLLANLSLYCLCLPNKFFFYMALGYLITSFFIFTLSIILFIFFILSLSSWLLLFLWPFSDRSLFLYIVLINPLLLFHCFCPYKLFFILLLCSWFFLCFFLVYSVIFLYNCCLQYYFFILLLCWWSLLVLILPLSTRWLLFLYYLHLLYYCFFYIASAQPITSFFF